MTRNDELGSGADLSMSRSALVLIRPIFPSCSHLSRLNLSFCLSVILTQDLPSDWPWGDVGDQPQPDPQPALAKGRGRGRGRGRGKVDGVKGQKDSKDPGSAPAVPDKTLPKPRKAFLLANLVRAGNQMGLSSSWKAMLRNLRQLISDKIKIEPLSALPRDAECRLKHNTGVLEMLGKLSGPSKCMNDAAQELLVFLDCRF